MVAALDAQYGSASSNGDTGVEGATRRSAIKTRDAQYYAARDTSWANTLSASTTLGTSPWTAKAITAANAQAAYSTSRASAQAAHDAAMLDAIEDWQLSRNESLTDLLFSEGQSRETYNVATSNVYANWENRIGNLLGDKPEGTGYVPVRGFGEGGGIGTVGSTSTANATRLEEGDDEPKDSELKSDEPATPRPILPPSEGPIVWLTPQQMLELERQHGLEMMDRFRRAYRVRDPNVGLFPGDLMNSLSQDPRDFGGGTPNLYRYEGNHQTMATDPSGLREETLKNQQPFYLFPWSEFPGYDPQGGIQGPDGLGQNTFQKWVVKDPARARKFYEKFSSQWGDLIRHASKANDIPEGVAMAFIFSEVVNFRWNDYHDLGRTRGPGQLSVASIEYYGTRHRWEEKPNGTATDRGQIFVSQVRSLESLGQLHVPNYSRRSDEVYLMQQMYFVTWILSMQAKELALAARGGGTLQTSGGRSISVAPMSQELLSTERMTYYQSPPVGVDFHKNLGRLAIMLSQMNRHHPQATGGGEKMIYEGPYSPGSPQSTFLDFMFSNGFFTFEDGNLKANF